MKKFDFVVGNPPYNETIEGRSEDPPVYHFFYDSSVKIGNNITFITPSRFLFDTGKTPAKWNKRMLNSNHFKVLYYEPDGSKIFPTTDIKGGVSITSWDNNIDIEPIKTFYPHIDVKNVVIKVKKSEKLFFDSIIFSNTSYKYSKLFYEDNPDFLNRVSGGSKRYLSSTCFQKFPEAFTDNKINEEDVEVIGRERYKRTTKYFNRIYLVPPKNFNSYKLVLPSSNGSGIFGEVLSDPFVGKPMEGYTETFVTFGDFKSSNEADNCLKYIKTKFSRAMLSSKKVTQGNKNSKVWENVPLQDFTENSDIDWSKSIAEIDQQLYKKYGLSDEEIAFIEEKSTGDGIMTEAKISTTKEVTPVCYAYTTPELRKHDGWTKIGFTERDAEDRIREQVFTSDLDYKLEWANNAVYEGSNETFRDSDFHKYLVNLGFQRKEGKEWFEIDPDLAELKFFKFRKNRGLVESDDKPAPYQLRNEQAEAVAMTVDYFKSHDKSEFLWNAKPRFGKTLATYDLCMRMGFENILIVTNRPAIADSWYGDYVKFVGPGSGYIFVSHVDTIKDEKYVYSRKEFVDILPTVENYKACIEFVSLQDLKGSIHFGGIHDKLDEIKNTHWDILIIDEAHEGVDTYKTDTAFNQIERRNTLHLSGTPFKALANEKFPDDAIYNWTYADEQNAKRSWISYGLDENPYATLPQLNLFTYQMSDVIRDRIEDGIELDDEVAEYAFDLNEFFSTDERGAFVYNNDVDKFLDALTQNEKFPFSTPELRDEIKHSFWILNRVDSAKALKRKLEVNPVFKHYKIVLAAGDGKTDDELISEDSLNRVKAAIRDYEKTITISVGQLTTGVTIPEWTAVLMLANMKSPALYMQAAFRSQNPCLFSNSGRHYRKKNAYVFDFDPARTLDIFEKFANDLSPDTSAGGGNLETRKKHIRELLNFFPVYGEDEDGQMVLLDAEKVLTIPRRIKSVEVVNRGFMSNFLFRNIANIFRAPSQVRGILEKLNPAKEAKAIQIDDGTADELDMNDNGDIEISKEKIIGKAHDVFGPKVYDDINEDLDSLDYEIIVTDKKSGLDNLVEKITKPIIDPIIHNAKDEYGKDLRKSVAKDIERTIKNTATSIIKKGYSDFEIERNKIEVQKSKDLEKSKSSAESSQIESMYESMLQDRREKMATRIKEDLADYELVDKSIMIATETIETDKREKKKRTIEDDARDRLRGFARTIPSFLMAYGAYDTNLDNFDKIIPNEVFLEVTSITLDEFRSLRDGFDYVDEETGETKHFEGGLFDELVFNDSVIEFLNKKKELENYFDPDIKRDIFDYIPAQKTNQIFTPRKVVNQMLDLLEEENPGCFDNPDFTFLDPYMKSGLYVAEIVKRLYRSEKIKGLYPDSKARLNHIFANQVYGLAPTKIIYRIACNYVLGFSKDIKIEKHNLRHLDSLESIQNDRFEDDLVRIFPELED